MDGLGADTRQSKITRAAFGAFYGFLGGLAFVFMAAYIDILLNPDVSYGVDWSTLATRLPLIAFGLALVGAVTCWWHAAWQGLTAGALVASALALIVALFTAEVGAGLKIVVLVFILIPIAAMALPIAYALRWLTERHALALHTPWSTARIAGLIVLALALGAGCGYFMKTSPRGVEVARYMQSLLQNPAQTNTPLAKMDGVLERQGLSYKLYQQKSTESTVGYDFRVEYEDGFTLRCAVIAYPGATPLVSKCETDQ